MHSCHFLFCTMAMSGIFPTSFHPTTSLKFLQCQSNFAHYQLMAQNNKITSDRLPFKCSTMSMVYLLFAEFV